MNSIIVNTDGGSRGNPGPAAIGVVIKDETGKIVGSISRRINETTNNVAEYSAVIAALEWIKENLNRETIIQFFIDSALVVNQLNGLFKIKNPDIRNLVLKVRILEQGIASKIIYNQIPREKNQEADLLVNKALDA